MGITVGSILGCSTFASEAVLRLNGRHHNLTSALEVSPDGKRVLLETYGSIGLCTLENWKLVEETHEPVNDCQALTFSPDGNWIATGSGRNHSPSDDWTSPDMECQTWRPDSPRGSRVPGFEHCLRSGGRTLYSGQEFEVRQWNVSTLVGL